MPLMILGLVFVIGLFIYYLVSTGSSRRSDPAPKPKKEEDYKQEENVIFLPNDIEKAKEKHRRGR